MLVIDVLTIFPRMFDGPLGESIIARAAARGLVSVRLHNPRQYCTDKHQSIDDTPYGGGGGMVMRPEPLCACLDAVIAAAAAEGRPRPRVVFMCPQGRRLDQTWARELAGIADCPQEPTPSPRGLVLVCGRYEAIDERVHLLYQDDRLSIGDFVLSGGEPAAIVLIDVLTRLQPGALGCGTSAHMDSFSPGNNGLLDAPHYTRPEEFRGLRVPEVLLSGNHERIARWRAAQGLERTWRWRPDLLSRPLLSRGKAEMGRSSHKDAIDNESKLNE